MPNTSDSEKALRSLVDSAAVYIYVVDCETDEILMVNDYYARNLGVARKRMEGAKCWEFVMGEGEGRCPFCPRAPHRADGGGLPSGPHRAEDGAVGAAFGTAASTAHDGAAATAALGTQAGTTLDTAPHSAEAYNPTLGLYGRVTAQAVDWVDGRKAHVITVSDVSGEKILRDELLQLAYYDRQLNIPNLAKLEKDLADRKNDNYCVIAFDYISLRYINDAYGRATGDALLKTVAEWIKSIGIAGLTVYRIEGDQFCLLIDGADMVSASGLADRIAGRFQEPWDVGAASHGSFVTSRLSICVIDGRTGFESPARILSIIERTLHISKSSGAVAVYDQEMDRILKKDLDLEISLKDSVTNGMEGFEVFFQPIVDPNKGVWQGLEALARWTSPEFGRVPPLVFIKMAEQMGLINTIGQWVLDRATHVCTELKLHEIKDFFLDVNLSPLQMSDESLVSKVTATLQKYGFPGHCLALEITESEEVEVGGYSQTIVERLRAHGIKIALDDFGTGYSNFNNLKSMPVGILKTEKQFIDDIAVSEYQQFLSYVLARLAHAADMKLIAEGVETPAQMRALIKNSVDYFQGYLFAHPLNAADLAAHIAKFADPDPIFAEARRELAEPSGHDI